ncbi:microcompartment protein [Neosynechococcus sphagnicola sy1]|uniref:Microcompartment protein n=1 Tax=Neosynechococcus sphagnicola sy1 TaxID=1497020 RepID=A0A098TM07_9CYAN|nr:BMC domain-containing protein [Neosynechococcus sphagnicola]KGF73296.1 microcompartment protein [Neosynechococcus sphagnicola sy1]
MALGLVATQSFPAIVGTADMMLKSSAVTLVGYEKIGGGHCTAVVRGRIADVRLAVECGADTAEKFGQLIAKLVIARPLPNLDAVLPIGSRLAQLTAERGYSRMSNLAVGLLETRGFPAMVGASDAMLKAADVKLVGYETIGDGLCTTIIRGTVSNVAVAVEAGMHEAERIGELHAVMVIPRPLDDLEQTLPIANYFLEQPIQLPVALREKEQEPVRLPQLEQVSEPLVYVEELPLSQRVPNQAPRPLP